MNSPLCSTFPTRSILAFALVLFVVSFQPVKAQEAQSSLPKVVLGPPGKLVDGDDFINDGICFSELFDKPDQWKEARALTDCLLYADWSFNIFSDADLQRYFAQMKEWNLKLELEVGALKEWGVTGEGTFQKQQATWERIQRLGGNIYSLAFDEPLCCARFHMNKSDEYAMEETAKFIAAVRKKYPQILLGDIETYPSISIEDNIKWIEGLQKRLAEMKVKGLDFYRLDVNWIIFDIQNKGSWRDVKKLEQYCQSQKLPFSLVYWSPTYAHMARYNLSDDSTWYTSIMSQGYAYKSVEGAPQQYVVESWVGAPSHSVPETSTSTFMGSALEFVKKFAKSSK